MDNSNNINKLAWFYGYIGHKLRSMI